MKKLGFTLAEVMVALALIGVIASITIPTFVQNNQNKTHAAKLATTISAIENAFTSMIAAEAVQDMTETDFAQAGGGRSLDTYLKISNHTDSMTDYYASDNPFIYISTGNYDSFGADEIYEIKNGALIMFVDNPTSFGGAAGLGGTIDGKIGELTIDINGKQAPNIWGRDAFYFIVGNDGLLYPAGSLNFSIIEEEDTANLWDSENSAYSCTDTDKGLGCTARLIENNYEVDY